MQHSRKFAVVLPHRRHRYSYRSTCCVIVAIVVCVCDLFNKVLNILLKILIKFYYNFILFHLELTTEEKYNESLSIITKDRCSYYYGNVRSTMVWEFLHISKCQGRLKIDFQLKQDNSTSEQLLTCGYTKRDKALH
uniref:Uncharacterized protein n=1 Tax=Glossina pallidipes TaxID=7398 RepID=A0A1B0A249_GLOPL